MCKDRFTFYGALTLFAMAVILEGANMEILRMSEAVSNALLLALMVGFFTWVGILLYRKNWKR